MTDELTRLPAEIRRRAEAYIDSQIGSFNVSDEDREAAIKKVVVWTRQLLRALDSDSLGHSGACSDNLGGRLNVGPANGGDPDPSNGERQALSFLGCPDGGVCHHGCADSCWRVSTCLPLSASGWVDWPDEIKAANQPVARFENALLASRRDV